MLLIEAILIRSLAGAAVVLTVTRSSAFGWLRAKLLEVSPGFLGKLFNCPFCFGFWTALLLEILNTWPWGGDDPRIIIQMTLACWAVQSALAGLVYKGVSMTGTSREEKAIQQHHNDGTDESIEIQEG